MATKDPRVDAYIEKSAEFARPILTHIRDLIHKACPDVEETIKWSMPHFLYKGMLCHMAAFRAHCSLGFWKSGRIIDGSVDTGEEGLGQFGKLTSVKDLPPTKILAGYIKKAMVLNEEREKSPPPKPRVAKEVIVPEALARALSENTAALAHFDKLSPSHQREYVEWITEAKSEATRTKRLGTTISWLIEGKSRHWKYANC